MKNKSVAKTRNVIKCDCGFAYDGDKFLECPQVHTHKPIAATERRTASPTPMPWEKVNYDGKWLIDSVDKVGSIAVINGGRDRLATANADFIVRAVNSYEELLEALRAVCDTSEINSKAFKIAQQAVAKAEGR